jgi:hypothetical protein
LRVFLEHYMKIDNNTLSLFLVFLSFLRGIIFFS